MIGMQTGDNVYSILLTPSLLFVLLFESKTCYFSCFNVA